MAKADSKVSGRRMPLQAPLYHLMSECAHVETIEPGVISKKKQCFKKNKDVAIEEAP